MYKSSLRGIQSYLNRGWIGVSVGETILTCVNIEKRFEKNHSG
jgi:hypothetical protein